MKIIFIFFSLFCFNIISVKAETSFLVKPIVSIIISGDQPSHVLEVLDTAKSLSKKARVRNIVLSIPGNQMMEVAGGLSSNNLTPEEEAEQKKILAKNPQVSALVAEYKKRFKDLGLIGSNVTFDSTLISRLRLSYSPTWIVRHEGKDYVFEGYSDISRYFSQDGVFNY